MNKTVCKLKKVTLLVLVLAFTLAASPMSTASAAGLTYDDTPPTNSADRIARLAVEWERVQNAYDRQKSRLERADNFISSLQSKIYQANQNGKDTSAIQAALDVYAKAIQDTNPFQNSAKGFISSHKGFDASGKVIDRNLALDTVRFLRQSMKEIRDLVGDPFNLLRDALKAFRESNRTAKLIRTPTP